MQIIQEKVFDVSMKDIIFIINSIQTVIFKMFPNWNSINTNFFRQNSFKSEILMARIDDFIFNSIDCQTAKSEIPLQINFGMVKSNVMYPPLSLTDKTSPYIINFGFNIIRLREVKTIILENNLNGIIPYTTLERYMAIDDFRDFKLYFSENRLQNALTHEITHWLDDYHHNQAVRKQVLLQKFNSKIEMNAQVHVIAMLKLRNLSHWDQLTIFEVLKQDQSLKDTYRKISELDKKEAIKWLKLLMKRLYREKLLGKKMNYIPNNDMQLMEDFCFENFLNEKYYDIKKYL